MAGKAPLKFGDLVANPESLNTSCATIRWARLRKAARIGAIFMKLGGYVGNFV